YYSVSSGRHTGSSDHVRRSAVPAFFGPPSGLPFIYGTSDSPAHRPAATDLHRFPVKSRGARLARRQLPAALGGGRNFQSRASLLRAPLFLPEGRDHAGALRAVSHAVAPAQRAAARRHARTGTRARHALRGARRISTDRRAHRGSGRRNAAPRVRGAEGAFGAGGPLRRRAQAAAAAAAEAHRP